MTDKEINPSSKKIIISFDNLNNAIISSENILSSEVIEYLRGLVDCLNAMEGEKF